jgi:hypothetical protein
MTSSVYNDMPGELREKIRLWDVLNKILKNNGFIDTEAISTEFSKFENSNKSITFRSTRY